MKATWSLILFFLLVTDALLGRNGEELPLASLAIIGVTVIDATGEPAKTNMTVVVTGDRITEIGTTRSVRLPKDARVMDGSGKYLIPGLWDMHVHCSLDQTWGQTVYVPLLVANGITGIRDMGGPGSGDPKIVFHLREEIREGKLLGPRIVAAGYMLEGSVNPSKTMIGVTNASDGRTAVDLVKKSGADFVKVYDMIPREAYFAIADEARKQSIPFAGHAPLSVDAVEAAVAGQRSIEHEYGILSACSTKGEEFRNQVQQDRQQGVGGKLSSAEMFKRLVRRITDMVESYNDKKAELVFNRLAQQGTWVCPTFTVLRAIAYSDDPSLASDPRLRYIPLHIRSSTWNLKSNPMTRNLTSEDHAAFRRDVDKWLETAGKMRHAGVRFLAGTDVCPGRGFGANIFPGFSLHDELTLFVKAGFTPMEALQTATRNPAEFLGTFDKLGTIETGKLADLVLLDANPLENIANTRQINAVVVNGRLLDKQMLQNLLGQAEMMANRRFGTGLALISIAAALLIYLATYFLSARVNYGGRKALPTAVPVYRPWNANIVRIIFRPAHLLDAAYLRPNRWR